MWKWANLRVIRNRQPVAKLGAVLRVDLGERRLGDGLLKHGVDHVTKQLVGGDVELGGLLDELVQIRLGELVQDRLDIANHTLIRWHLVLLLDHIGVLRTHQWRKCRQLSADQTGTLIDLLLDAQAVTMIGLP